MSDPADPKRKADGPDEASPLGLEVGDDALSPSFRLTVAFLRRYPRYRSTLALTPEHFLFDPVLWNSSMATLRAMLAERAEEAGLPDDEDVLEAAVRNLVEGILRRAAVWGGGGT